jgi:hypothetical protein
VVRKGMGEATVNDQFFIGISYVGGPQYTHAALKSLGKYRRNVLIIDCREDESALAEISLENAARIIRPEIPFSHTQVHNYFQREAIRHNQPFYFVMHNDAEASPEVIDHLVYRMTNYLTSTDADSPKVAVIFTNYDALACYSTEAAKVVGPWDWRLFPSYYSDPDFYRRCRLAGYELLDTGLPVKHEGSHVINKVNKQLKYLNHRLTHNQAREAFIAKWGGPPGEEKFIKPFDGEMENCYPDE